MKQNNSWHVYRTRFLVRARQLTEPMTFVDSLGREHSGCSGDYFVETSDGICRITSRALFEDIYVLFEPEPVSTTVERRPASHPIAKQSANEVARATA